eukprot:1161195-Pelagomonas_calceolata.AAC.12
MKACPGLSLPVRVGARRLRDLLRKMQLRNEIWEGKKEGLLDGHTCDGDIGHRWEIGRHLKLSRKWAWVCVVGQGCHEIARGLQASG